MTLRQLIVEALAAAEINGYMHVLILMTDDQLTDDLMDFDADIGKYPRDDVLETVMEIRAESKHRKVW